LYFLILSLRILLTRHRGVKMVTWLPYLLLSRLLGVLECRRALLSLVVCSVWRGRLPMILLWLMRRGIRWAKGSRVRRRRRLLWSRLVELVLLLYRLYRLLLLLPLASWKFVLCRVAILRLNLRCLRLELAMRRLLILGLMLLCLCSILPCIHRLLHRLNPLISLCVETRIYCRLCIFELLPSL
jgi:hypothetical protein